MGKPRGKDKRAETPGVSGPQGKVRLQQVKKPEKSSVHKEKKKRLSPGQQGCSTRVTRFITSIEPYEKNYQACLNEGSSDEVAELGDDGGIGTAGLSYTIPVKIEEWKGKLEQGIGKGLSDDDHGEIVIDIPSIGEIKEERMSDDDGNEVGTEEGLGDFMMDYVSKDKELSSDSVVNSVLTGPVSNEIVQENKSIAISGKNDSMNLQNPKLVLVDPSTINEAASSTQPSTQSANAEQISKPTRKKKNICYDCLVKFDCSSKLSQHIADVHPGLLHKCLFCNFYFYKITMRRKHMKSDHASELEKAMARVKHE